MKKIRIIITLLTLGSLFLYSQEDDKIQISVRYLTKYKLVVQNERQFDGEGILEIGKKYSVYYDLWSMRRQEAKDSVAAIGGSSSDIMNAAEETGYPRSLQNYQVYKNFPKKGLLTYTDKSFKDFKYTEELEKPNWEILSGDTLIYDYPCLKAQTKFRGRTWTVWFTQAIPVNDGPWKLWGLPGLILSAWESDGFFSFKCVGITQPKEKLLKKMGHNKYITCSPKQFADLIKEKWLNLDKYLSRFGISKAPAWNADGTPLVRTPKQAILLEKIYE